MCLQNRCITAALPTLRPFQRKIAYINMANALVDSLSGLIDASKDRSPLAHGDQQGTHERRNCLEEAQVAQQGT
jgi:hypothetical protein